jgi:hypothetical protein
MRYNIRLATSSDAEKIALLHTSSWKKYIADCCQMLISIMIPKANEKIYGLRKWLA